MYNALCVSGAVNTQGFMWKFLCAIYTFLFIHSFIHTSLPLLFLLCQPLCFVPFVSDRSRGKTLNKPILHSALDVRTNGLPSTWDFVISR